MPGSNPSYQEELTIYKEMLGHLDDVVFSHDPEGNFLYLSPSWAKMIGYSPDQIKGLDFRKALAPEFLEEATTRTLCQIRGETVEQPWDCQIVDRDGNRVWVQIRTQPVYDSDGKLVKVYGVARDIGKRKALEEKIREHTENLERLVEERTQTLRESEENYRTLLNNTLTGIYLRRNEELILVNDRLAEMLGYAKDELVGSSFLKLVHYDDRSFVERDASLTLSESDGPNYGEFRALTKTGDAIWVETIARTIEYHGEEVVLGNVIDITDRKNVEESLRRSEARINSIFRAAPTGIGLVSNRIIIDANDLLCQMTGYLREELIGQSARILYPTDEDYEYVGREKYAQIARQGTGSVETRWKRKDGEIIDVLLSSTPLDPDDLPAGVTFTALDITERKRAHNQVVGLNSLKEKLLGFGRLDKKLRLITDVVVDVFDADFARIWFIEDGDRCESGCYHAAVTEGPHVCKYRDKCLHLMASSGRYTHIDGEIHRRVPFGCYKIGRIASREEDKFLVDDVPHNSSIHDAEWAKACGLVSFAGYKLLSEEGEPMGVLALFSKNTISADEDALLETVAGTASQVIRTAKAEEEIRKLNEELEQRVADRTAQLKAANKELEAFAYSVSHDLRAPLRGIDGFSQALLEDYEDRLDSQGIDYLHRVRSASQRMGELIDDLLGLSRVTRQEMRRELVDMRRIAKEIADKLKEEAPDRDAEIKVEDGPAVRGDPSLIRLAIENLIGNAWKFTEKKPQAKIEFGNTVIDGQSVWFVRDNGAGFDMKYDDKLFGPFQRLHRNSEFQGTGIGLATVQRIIHRHGGTIWAESKVGQGATFYFTL